MSRRRIDGITEPVIFRETAKLHGLSTDRADFERFADALTDEYLERAAELRERGHALPGAAAALDALDTRVQQTVVSGNIRAVAELKLQVFGLDRLDPVGPRRLRGRRATYVPTSSVSPSNARARLRRRGRADR